MLRDTAIVLLHILLFSGVLLAAEKSPTVRFDTPAIAIAERIHPAMVAAPTTGGDLMRLKIPISTMISPEFRGTVSELVVEFVNPTQSMRVIDFWPRNELVSEFEGNIAVESKELQDSHFDFKLSGGYEPFARGAAQGESNHRSEISERYQRKPPMQVLTSSGTVQRGYGLFFKFSPGPNPMLEGTRDVAILVEVPQGWRADMLQVSMRAVGRVNASSSATKRDLGTSRLWVATHREGDVSAAALARQYVAQERALRVKAYASQQAVDERALPTVWHKLGSAVDVIDPRIPKDYLVQVLFGPANQHFHGGTQRLPVDLRVAILDYWQQRDALLALANSLPEQHIVAKPKL